MKFFSSEMSNQIAALIPPVTEKKISMLGREMHAIELITNFEPDHKELLGKIVKEYVGQREFVKQVALPEEFGVAPEDIVEAPEGAYHFDLVIKTAPKGGLFIEDFDTTLDLLKGIRNANLLAQKDPPILKS